MEFVLAADGKSDKAWNRYGTTGQGFCLVTDIPLMAKRLPFLKESSKKCGGKITIFYLFLKPMKEHLLDSRKLTIDRYESRSANCCAVHQAVNLDCTIFPSPWKKHSVFFILSTQGRWNVVDLNDLWDGGYFLVSINLLTSLSVRNKDLLWIHIAFLNFPSKIPFFCLFVFLLFPIFSHVPQKKPACQTVPGSSSEIKTSIPVYDLYLWSRTQSPFFI